MKPNVKAMIVDGALEKFSQVLWRSDDDLRAAFNDLMSAVGFGDEVALKRELWISLREMIKKELDKTVSGPLWDGEPIGIPPIVQAEIDKWGPKDMKKGKSE